MMMASPSKRAVDNRLPLSGGVSASPSHQLSLQTQKLRSGNLGIGQSSPSAFFFDLFAEETLRLPDWPHLA